MNLTQHGSMFWNIFSVQNHTATTDNLDQFTEAVPQRQPGQSACPPADDVLQLSASSQCCYEAAVHVPDFAA